MIGVRIAGLVIAVVGIAGIVLYLTWPRILRWYDWRHVRRLQRRRKVELGESLIERRRR